MVFEELFQKNKNTDVVEIKEQSWAKMNELANKNWDDYRKPYASVIKNLLIILIFVVDDILKKMKKDI